MKCPRCGKPAKAGIARCPYCGHQAGAPASGVFQTATVLVFARGSEGVYRSVEDVPPTLRARLLKSTSGANSATLLIADRRGRREIARAMRAMPAPLQQRLVAALVGKSSPTGGLRFTRVQKSAIGVALLAIAAAVVWVAVR